MAFTYDLATDAGKVRFEVGDTAEQGALFTDAEIEHLLAEHGGVLAAAAAACEQLATRFAYDVDVSTDGQSLRRSSRSQAYAERARALRARANSVQSIPVTRTDGYSDDLTNRDGSPGERTGRVRRGYTDPDLPV